MTLFNVLGLDKLPNRKYYFQQACRIRESVSTTFSRLGLNVYRLKVKKIQYSKRN